jgi:D-inositol-3-phosphate glycosyltransferase
VDGHHAKDWADALEAMYDDPDTRADMGRAASIRAENLGWNRTAAITLETYHAAVEEKLAGRPALPLPTIAAAAEVAAVAAP